MADKRDYLAKVRAKGLDATGVTEDLAKQFWHQLGSRHLFVVEAHVEDRAESTDGGHVAFLVLDLVEPSTSPHVDDHLRELMAAMYRHRAQKSGDALPGTLDGPTTEDVINGSGEAILDRSGAGVTLWDGNTDDRPGGSCAFPGCQLAPEHDGDHDPFREAQAGHEGPLPEVPDSAYPDGAEDVYPPGHPNAGMAVEHPEPTPDPGTKKLTAVPDPFASTAPAEV